MIYPRPDPEPVSLVRAAVQLQEGPHGSGFVGRRHGGACLLENGAVVGEDEVGEELLVESDDAAGHGFEFCLDDECQGPPGLAHGPLILGGCCLLAADRSPRRGVREFPVVPVRHGQDETYLPVVDDEADGRPVGVPAVHEAAGPVPGQDPLDLSPRRRRIDIRPLRVLPAHGTIRRGRSELLAIVAVTPFPERCDSIFPRPGGEREGCK